MEMAVWFGVGFVALVSMGIVALHLSLRYLRGGFRS